MLERVTNGYFRAIEFLLVACLALMAAMVFGNVVLRYVFNSGITVSEELSRFLFIWLTFLGAITGVREGTHLGMDTMLKALPRLGRSVCVITGEALTLLCCVLFFWGTWQQHDINMGNLAPVTEIPMEWVYSVVYLCAGSIAIMVAVRLVLILTGRMSADDLIIVDAEEAAALHQAGADEPAAGAPLPATGEAR
ncbi:MAG TPA: TRAP transporter small permease [Ramlibacter sp.]|nr:TRAP transporter small permease [Ramlibacter sp.]